MAGVLAALYGLLYLILILEDDTLLAGALLGFPALTTVMFATLRIDWSGAGPRRGGVGGRLTLNADNAPTGNWCQTRASLGFRPILR